MLEPATGGQTLSNARKVAVAIAQEIGEVVGGGFAFNVRAERENHFHFPFHLPFH